MIIADWVIIGLIAFFCLIGFIVGFGKGLDFFTGGIFGFLISIAVCYCLGGFIYKIQFVQDLLLKLTTALTNKHNGFCDFLVKIHIDIIVYYVALFIIVTIIRIMIVRIVSSIAEVDNPLLKFVNKTLGIVFFAFVLAALVLITFDIISLIGGSTAESFDGKLAGSKLKLDWIYEHNPLVPILKNLKVS